MSGNSADKTRESLRGTPRTLSELAAAVENTANAFYLAFMWEQWIENGLSPECFAESPLPEMQVWERAPVLKTDDPAERKAFAFELYQFIVRALLRDWGTLVETYMESAGIKPQYWSQAPDPIYILRILRDAVTHGWTVGRVHRTVSWQHLTFQANQGQNAASPGCRVTDPIEPYLAGGGDMLRALMIDVGIALDAMQKQHEASQSAS